MRRLLTLFTLLFLSCVPALAQIGQRSYGPVTTTTPDIGISNIGSNIAYHQLSWNPVGTVSGCTVKLQQSSDNSTWSDLIGAQTCTTAGQSAVTNGSVNYTRIDPTTVTVSGGGYVVFTWNGWNASPSGGGTGTSLSGQSLINVSNNTTGANTLTWTRLGAVIGTPLQAGGSLSLQEPSAFIQTSPQILSTGFSQVVGMLYTCQGGGNICYAEAPNPQGPFTPLATNVLGNVGCASNVLSISGQLVMFACAGRVDIHRYHSTTHGVSWVDDGVVVTHVPATWLNAAENSSILIVNGTCYLWVEGDANGTTLAQGLWTGNSTCAANSFTEQAGDPQIPTSEINGGGPFVYYDGTTFWQWEHGGSTTASAYPTYLYFTQLNSNGAGTPPPHTHTQFMLPRFVDEGAGFTNGINAQVADPFLLEWPYAQGDSRNTTYLYYSTCSENCASPQLQALTLNVASIPLPMKSIAAMTQADQGVQYSHMGWEFVQGLSSNTPLPVPTLFDSANRANSTNMGNDWSAVYSNNQAQIVSNRFEPSASSGSARPIHVRVQPCGDCFASVQLIAAASTSTTGLLLRGSPISGSQYYECVTVNALGSSQSVTIRRWNGSNSLVTIATTTGTPQANDWMVFTAVGTTLTCMIYDSTGNIIVSGTDTNIASGYVGMTVIDATPANAILDNWSGGSINGDGSMATQQSQIWTTPQLFQQAVLQPYLVANLPSAASVKSGTTVVVTDATTFTVGTCTGGGSDTMLAVSNGTSWSCH